MRLKYKGLRYKGLGPAQRAVFERIATGESSPSCVHPKTIESLLRRGFIVRAGSTKVGADRLGSIEVPAYEVPLVEHIEWCAWCGKVSP